MSESMKGSLRRPELPSVDFDWPKETWQEVGRRLLDLAASASTDWRGRRPSPPDTSEVLGRFRDLLPQSPVDIDRLIARLAEDLIPSAAHNGHPRWFAYITASPVPISVLGDLLASALNQNTALWRLAPAATAVELQTVDWLKDILGYPATAEGIFVSGGQMANIVAHAVLRDFKAPWDTRRYGARGPTGDARQLRIYASQEMHYCHQQAAEFLGLGRETIREVPVDARYRMRTDALTAMIAEDRARGDLPIAVVGTAGTVGTGAVDPLGELLAVARAEDLWFHVDGAYGAFAALAPSGPDDLEFIAEADSVACDPHKWLYSAIDAGVVLMRKQGLLERSFAFHAKYLESDGSAEQVDLLERSPENTRPFRALKVWLALQVYGRDGYRDMIERNLQLAIYMEKLVDSTPGLVLAAPRQLSIVCWRVEPTGLSDPARLERLQTRVIDELEARGIAMVSNAALSEGRNAIRACVVNFRTSPEDVEAVVQASAAIGQEEKPVDRDLDKGGGEVDRREH
ncbi:MAG: pyridoxal-dependent decarboxylase [Kiloniellales bacterium]